MANLYQVRKEIEECFDEETGEVLDVDRLMALNMDAEEKVESIVLFIKNLNADAAAYKAEKEAFAQREKTASNKVERLKKWLAYALEGQKFQTQRCAVSFRRTEAVEIVNEEAIPEEFFNVKIEKTPNKTAIKEALKAGADISGCGLKQNLAVMIK